MRYLYKKEQDEEHYFIFTHYFMHCASMFNKSTARQNKRLGTNPMGKRASYIKYLRKV